jgi:Mrp family chromosome partitioning ATPase
MSRNFELLQKVEKEREANLQRELQVQRSFPSVEDAVNSTQTLHHLEMDDFSRVEITKMVERLFLIPESCKAVVFSAVEHGDGCSWIAARTATQLAARVIGSVCLVDANFHAPSLDNVFGVDNVRGLRDALSKPGAVRGFAQRVSPANLWLLPAGAPSLPGERSIESESVGMRIGELRRDFDFVLIDTPPLSLCADAISLAHSADGIAVVVGANSTRRDMSKQAVSDLGKSKVRLIGTVFNKRTSAIPAVIHRRLQRHAGRVDF